MSEALDLPVMEAPRPVEVYLPAEAGTAHIEAITDLSEETYHMGIMVSAAELVANYPDLTFDIDGPFRGWSGRIGDNLHSLTMVYVGDGEKLLYLWVCDSSSNLNRQGSHTFMKVNGSRLAYRTRAVTTRRGLRVSRQTADLDDMKKAFHSSLNVYNPAQATRFDRPRLIANGIRPQALIDHWRSHEDPKAIAFLRQYAS